VIIHGIRLEIDFSFLIFTAVIFLLRDSSIILGFFAVSTLHELGHGLALYAAGGRIGLLSLWGMGIKMQPERGLILTVKEEAAVLLAGPLSNLLLYGAVQLTAGECLFGYMNLAAAVFNLLPYGMLDGGSLLDLLQDHSVYRIIGTILKLFISVGLFAACILTDRDFFIPFCVSAIYLLRDIIIER